MRPRRQPVLHAQQVRRGRSDFIVEAIRVRIIFPMQGVLSSEHHARDVPGGEPPPEHAGGDWAIVETQVNQSVRTHFKPEFLNRVDDIIIFRPLGKAEIEHIIDLQLKRLEQLLADRKLTLELTPQAREVLATEGYDPAFGARPLKRAIQRLLQNPLALAVLEGRFTEGDHIIVERDPKGELTFRKAKAREPALAGR